MGQQSPKKEQQQTSLQYIITHHKLVNFLLYCFSCVCFGMSITCMGPMFPYLAAKQNRQQTEYSFLFTCKALGFGIGALSVKLIQNKFTLHHFLAIGVSLMGAFSILFYFPQSLAMKGLCIFVASVGCAYQDIAVNLAALLAFQNDNTAMWLQMIHGFFGIGGLVGPFIVYIFQLKSIAFIGILSIISSAFYLCVHSPEHGDPYKNQQAQEENNIKNKLQIPKISFYIICSLFFFNVGQQVTYGGWISSFAVLYDFSSKQHATMYSSLYWISITIFRFILAAVKGSPSKKIQIFGIIGVVNSLISYFFIFYVNYEFGLIFMSVFYGLYALLLIIPQQFGYKLTIKDTTNFVIWASLGQGCLAAGVGKMMGWFSYNWLIYGMLFMNFAILILAKFNVTIMMKQKQKQKISQECLLQKNQKNKHIINQYIQLREIGK